MEHYNDYREKYNTALERASKLRVQNPFDTVSQMVEHIFPELSESEDERIREAIIALIEFGLEDKSAIAPGHNVIKEDAIAWLEKQGEQPTDKIEPNPAWSEEDEGMLKWLCRIIHSQRILKVITLKEESELGEWMDKWLNHNPQTKQREIDDAYLQGICDAKNEIEKQGEPPITDFEIPFGAADSELQEVSYYIPEGFYAEIKDDRVVIKKVEPKFKNGQWIVWQDKCYKVNYNGCGYELIDQNGLSTSLEYGTIDKNAHLWDITKDAKDGDVLATSVGAFIYDSKNGGDSRPGYYCGINTLGKFQVSSGKKWTNKEVYPATKEQRDLLFAKMHDAGYEWDAKKKQLKKIEPKTLNADKVIEWLNNQACQGWIEDVEVDKFIEKFKKDFGL